MKKLLIICILIIGIVSISGCTSEEKTNSTKFGAGTNVSKEEVSIEEATKEDIVFIEHLGGGTYIDVSPVKCSSNLRTTSIKGEEFDEGSIKSEGVWFTEKPTTEPGNHGNVVVISAVKKENIEKFYLKIDDNTFDNLRIVKSDESKDYSNIVIDADVPYVKVNFDTLTATKFPFFTNILGPQKDAETIGPKEGLIIAKGIKNEHMERIEIILIIIHYQRPLPTLEMLQTAYPEKFENI